MIMGTQMGGSQRERSAAERALPEYIRNALDRARSGTHPMFNSPMSPEDAANYVNAHLPEGDPGRL